MPPTAQVCQTLTRRMTDMARTSSHIIFWGGVCYQKCKTRLDLCVSMTVYHGATNLPLARQHLCFFVCMCVCDLCEGQGKLTFGNHRVYEAHGKSEMDEVPEMSDLQRRKCKKRHAIFSPQARTRTQHTYVLISSTNIRKHALSI